LWYHVDRRKTVDIVMLAAGTSSRMGKKNKMLLPYKDTTMVAHCCLEALRFLERHSLENNRSCTLIVVTGYRRRSVEKALLPCKLFVEKTDAPVQLLIVDNPDYRNGQFSSTKKGVAEVTEGSPFFISLADMPLVKPEHYAGLVPLLDGHDAVRPFCRTEGKIEEDKVPGHPVLHEYGLKETILRCPDNCTVSRILRDCNVSEPLFTDPSWIRDVDSEQDYRQVNS